MGLLDGQMAAAIYAGFKGKLLPGTLRKAGIADSAGLDALGDPLATSPATHDCQGFTDAYSAFSRAQAGIPTTDLKVCIFGKSLPAGVIPETDDKVSLTKDSVTTWYQLRRADPDPADALWTCQAFKIGDPDGS